MPLASGRFVASPDAASAWILAVVLLVDSVARDLRLGLDSVPRDLLRLAQLEGDVLGGDDDSLAGADDLGDRVEDERVL